MSESGLKNDRWQQQLTEQLEALKRCQQEKNLSSCLGCREILGCEIRTRYVNAVYESMNKGQGGGFEF